VSGDILKHFEHYIIIRSYCIKDSFIKQRL
jgi:hypothetical protein